MDLVPTSRSSTFTQQGTVDWVALANASVQIPVNILTRYSKAGVDAATVLAGQAVFLMFIMPPRAQQEVVKQLSMLSSVGLYSNVVRVGFGLQHVLQDLATKEGGISCLAICGCLTQSYNVFYSAQVIRALCQHQKMPQELVPGILQWEALLKPCNKIFSKSRFAVLLHEGFTPQLASRTNLRVDRSEATPPEKLAEVLTLLAQLSRRHFESLHLTGGIDCAWIAAVAIFVFDITVDVKTADDVYLYRSDHGYRTGNNEAQLTILKDTEVSASTAIARKCFILPSGRDLFKQRDRNSPMFENRSPWTSILRDSFGSTAEELLQGSVSRPFAMFLVHLAHREVTYQDGVNERIFPNEFETLPDMRQYKWSPFGNNILELAIRQFPELQPCLEAISFRKVSVAKEQAALSFLSISKACHCIWCESRRTGIKGNSDQHEYSQCLREVTLAIPQFIRLFSAVKIHSLLPLPDDFRSWCESRQRTPLRTHRGFLENRVKNLHGFFSSQSPPLDTNHSDMPLALAFGGVCCFMGFLIEANYGPELAATIHIMPGYLEYGGSMFERIQQFRPSRASLDIEQWSAFDFHPRKKVNLFVCDLVSRAILEVIYQIEDRSLQASSDFSLYEIISWAMELTQTQVLPCSCISLPPIHYIFEPGLNNEIKKTSWSFHITMPEAARSNDDDSNEVVLHNPMSSRFSLMFILTTQDGSSIEIHKSSSKTWNQYNFRWEQLYAKYGNEFKPLPDGRDVRPDIAPVGDCPSCIMAYVSSRWPRYLSARLNVIPGSIVLHTSGELTETIGFELRRIHEVQQGSSWWPFTIPLSLFSIPYLGGLPWKWGRQTPEPAGDS